MDQGQLNTEEKLGSVEDTKDASGDSYKRNSVIYFADKKMPSDQLIDRGDGFKNSNGELSVAKCADSNLMHVQRKSAENKMPPLNCPLVVPKIERALNEQANGDSNGSKVEQDIPIPSRKRQIDQSIPGGELNNKVTPTINGITNNNQTQNELVESRLVGLKITQAVTNCLQEVVDQTVNESKIGITSSTSLREFQQAYDQTIPKKGKSKKKETKSKDKKNPKKQKCQLPTQSCGMEIQPNFVNLSGSSSQEIVMVQSGKKPEVSKATKTSVLKNKRRKKFRKDFALLSAMLDEIDTMNEYYRKDIIRKNKEVRDIQGLTQAVIEDLGFFKDLPTHTINISSVGGEPLHQLNLLEYGTKLFQELSSLLSRMCNLFNEYNEFRLKFHDFCLKFLSVPLEQFIGNKRNDEINKSMETYRKIHAEFLGYKKFHSEFAKLSSNHKECKKDCENFSECVDILIDQI